jgi:hypothetical protein
MIKKTVNDIFSDKQIECLREKMWWVANRENPYVVKFAVCENMVLLRKLISYLEVSDFETLWACRV